jgi:hypothetical protein
MPFLRIVCLLLLLAIESAGQTTQVSLGSVPFTFLKSGQQQVQVPFQLQRNLIIVSVRLNDTGPYNFLLDTGVGTSLITAPAIADSLHLRQGQLYRVVGAGGEATGLLAYESSGVRFSLPGVVAPNMTLLVLSEDVLNLSGYVGMPIHGILGSEFFRSFVVTIRPAQNRLLLDAPATYQAPRSTRWASLPLSIESNKPYITIPVQLSDSLTLPLKLVLDTGAGHALSLEVGSHPRLTIPAHHLPSELGRGLTGVVRGSLGRVARLQLGRYRLRSVLTSFPDSGDVRSRTEVPRNGNIGFELLKRFSLIIDYPHQRLLLRPNTNFREPFEHDMCGLDLLATGPGYRRFLVLRVAPGSPAAAAGLAADEELMAINFAQAETFTLTQLSRVLHSYDGRLLFLVVRRRNGDIYTTTLRLKRQI